MERPFKMKSYGWLMRELEDVSDGIKRARRGDELYRMQLNEMFEYSRNITNELKQRKLENIKNYDGWCDRMDDDEWICTCETCNKK